MPQAEAYPLEWAWAGGVPCCHGTLRSVAEDFIVEEELGFEPDGEGSHAFLTLQKRHSNTEWLAQQLAELAGVSLHEVGYAGLKDRHALTTQHFTVPLAGRSEPDWSQLEGEAVSILAVSRHSRKLRRGELRGNRFTITLRDLHGECDTLIERLVRIRREGVPNYFGEQRFGRDHGNLRMAERLFRGELARCDRHSRGLYLSAARAYLFNRVLSARVAAGNWREAMAGEALLQPFSNSSLTLRQISEPIRERIARGELLPSGPLWGKGMPLSQGAARELELAAVAGFEHFQEGLAASGMSQERRALRLQVTNFDWVFLSPECLSLSFELPAGSYATAVIRELALADTVGEGESSLPD